MSEDPKGRVDILILRIAEELGNRLHAETTIDLRDHMKECAVHLIEDMRIPRTPVTPTTIVRSLLGISDRAVTPVRRKSRHGLRRVV
jgi:hypothetical protein